jgi:hypothetical protein
VHTRLTRLAAMPCIFALPSVTGVLAASAQASTCEGFSSYQLALEGGRVLRRWRSGELPCIRMSANSLRFEPGELDTWLHNRRYAD